LKAKGKDYFDIVVDNIMRALQETNISQVGVGFLYNPGTIREAGSIISIFEKKLRKDCPDQIHRFNIQFRPWRKPTGRPAINEQILSQEEIDDATTDLLSRLEKNQISEQFIKLNTNIAANLLCGGARENIDPFSECFYGLAKSVIRANGTLYPCFRVAATESADFNCGNIISDSPLKIALNELFVHIYSVKSICKSHHDKCLFCVFNNMLEQGIETNLRNNPESSGDYFF